MAISNSDSFHVTTILPLTGATDLSFVARLDSLGGHVEILGVERFLEILLAKKHGLDAHHIYEVSDINL